jgi:hypothetical protein
MKLTWKDVKERHICEFVPVGVTWVNYWTGWHEERTKPRHVVLACKCGNVKLVDAKVV